MPHLKLTKAMTQRLTKEQVKKLFQEFDNGNGKLSLAEIDRAVIYWHPEFGTNRQAILRAYKAADVDKTGFVELKEFRRLINLLYFYNELSGLFGQLDTNHDKRISFSEFKKGHELMSVEDIDEYALRKEFHRIDTNHGGYILFDEFYLLNSIMDIEITRIDQPSTVEQHQAIKVNMVPKPQSSNKSKKSSKIQMEISSKRFLLLFSIFTCISMIIGIIIVNFTVPKQNHICQMTFRQTIKSSIVYSSHPKSIAIGDLNHDNQTDIVVANPGTNTIGIFLSVDYENFHSQQTYSTGSTSQPNSVVLNYFNNDSYLDIAVANYGTNNIGLFFGQHNGTFENQILISTNSFRPWFISSDDLDHDNYSDLVIVFYGTDNIGILFGRNNGSFDELIIYSTGYDSLPYSLAIKDLNNDQHLDIVVTNYGTNNIKIFYNNGNRTLKNTIIYSTNYNSHPSSVVIADINNDQYFDIIVSNSNQENIGIFLNYGNETFTKQITHQIATKSFPQYVNVGYFDENNYLDIVIIDSINNQIHILLGYGNESFSTLTTYDSISGSSPSFVAIHDFNHDNQSDIAVVNSDTNNIMILYGYYIQPSTRQVTYFIGDNSRPNSVVVYDFNKDGELDIIVNAFRQSIIIFYGIGDGKFVQGNSYSTGENSSPAYLSIGDFNNDHRMDILVPNYSADNIGIFFGKDNGSFESIVTYSSGIGSQPWFAANGDLNNDTYLDIISSNNGLGTITIWFGLGNGSFVNKTTYSTGNNCNPFGIVIGDINNDNYMDLIFANQLSDIPGVFLGSNDGNFTLITKFLTTTTDLCFMVGLGDFNRDSYLDCAISCTDGAVINVFFGKGDGSFKSRVIYSTANIGIPYRLVVTDFNNDNYIDIVVAFFSSSEVAIYFNDGNGNFELSRLYSTDSGSNPYGLAIADLNHDNQLEIIATYWGTGFLGILTQYDAAKFTNQSTYSTGSAPYPYSLVVGDFNNDNQTDVVLANSATDNLSIRFGSKNGTFSNEIIYDIGSDSYPQYVITNDVNKDNYLDIVVINSKNNTMSLIYGYGNGSFADQLIYSTGDGSHPYSIVMNDLNNDQKNDLIIANEGQDNIGIFIGFDYTTFMKTNTYSIENHTGPFNVFVKDFNNDNNLDIAAIFYESSNLIILLGQENGSFIISMSYSTGNGSQPMMISAADINNDKQIDLIVV
ncbi:unnamed protein product, partial [Adineta steineri]